MQFAFRQSDFLYKPSDISDAEEIPGMTYRYCLHRLKAPPHRIPAYGILVKERTERGWEVIAVVAPFSRDKEAVELFAERCTRLQLSPKHLLDAIQDFLVP